MIDVPTFHETVEEYLKAEMQRMLDEYMTYEVHMDLYGIWCGPPNPVTHPWTIDGELGDRLFAEWSARGNGPKNIFEQFKGVVEKHPETTENVYVPTTVPEDAWW